jgi:DNA-binding response OmpR family regulator
MEAETLQTMGETLLIVDDEPLMTELFEKYMSKRGFRVLTAATGEEALQVVKREGTSIRLVITDMTMPSMDGLTLARELDKLAPTIPVMIATGHNADIESTAGLNNVVSVVRKPYRNNVLFEQIREVLTAHQPGSR